MRKMRTMAIVVAMAFATSGLAGCADKPAEKKDEAKKDAPKAEKAAEPAKKEEPKPAEVKPAEVKPAEVKPVEEKPAEVKPEEKPAEVKPVEEKPAEVKPVEEEVVVIDPAILAEITKLSACTQEQYDAYKCDVLETVITTLRPEGQKKDRSLAIVTTLGGVVLAPETQPQMKLAALTLIAKSNSLSVLYTLAEEPTLVTKGQAARYLKILALPDLPQRVAPDVAAFATKIATMGGETEALIKVLDEAKEKMVKNNGYQAIMTFGRMAAFPKIQEMAKSTDPETRRLALSSVGNMYKWTPEESAVICPWAEPFLADADVDAATEAGNLMVRCRLVDNGKYIDSLLAEGKKRVEAGTWTRPFVFPFRDVCFGGMMGEAEKPSPETCKKTYEFLEWATNYEKLDPDMRGMALSFIYYQARNEETLKILKKYENSPVEPIKKRALESIKSLEENYLKKAK